MHGFTLLSNRGTLAITGDDRVSFLNNLVTNEVSANEVRYAALLSPQGKFLHDFFIIPAGDTLLLDCEAARLPDLLQRLTRYKLRAQVTLADVSTSYITLALAPLTPLTAPAAHIFADPRHPALGQRALVAPDWLPDLKARCLQAGLPELTPDDYERHRLALCIPDGSRDMQVERAFPMDYGLDKLNAISFTKGCYIGQELTARMHHRGLVKKRLMRVAVSGPLPPPGTPVMAGPHEAGELCSGFETQALALLRLEYISQPLTCAGCAITPIPEVS